MGLLWFDNTVNVASDVINCAEVTPALDEAFAEFWAVVSLKSENCFLDSGKPIPINQLWRVI